MDVDPSWSFDDYQAYERTRLDESLAEHARAQADGLEVDPKSDPHGGYRIACVWPAQVTSAASALSARLAGLLPGTPAYPYQAIHSSIGNISAPDGKLVDPDRNREDRDLLDRLADAVEAALAADPLQAADGRRVTFGPALLSPRMALVFGRPQPGYWELHRAVHAASQPREIDLVTSWGPHLTLTRFAQPAGAEQLDAVYAEIVKGFEYRPVRRRVQVPTDGSELVFELERPLDLRRAGWVTADTHVHFVPPSTALLEAKAEGINLVNVLATQWGKLYTNVADFLASPVLDAAGETGVWVGSENRQPLLGHISLLNPGGPLFPFATGGAPTSPIGDPVANLMAEWADRCHAGGGIAVSPHFPFPYGEIAADIVLDKLDAIEIFGFAAAPDGPRIRDWYRFLNCGYQVPAVGGTDKMSAGTPLGAVRTYARLASDAPFGFDAWADAVRSGRTFVTSGPLLELSVEGEGPGGQLRLPPAGGTVTVQASVSSTGPVHGLEIVVNGAVVAAETAPDGSSGLRLEAPVELSQSSWVAARCTTRHVIRMAFPTAVAAHTSPVWVHCGDGELLKRADAEVLLALIEGGREWMRSLAVTEDAADRERFVEFFRSARARLQRRLDAAG
jgi:hypothetical protein